jgi:hypothetical protein
MCAQPGGEIVLSDRVFQFAGFTITFHQALIAGIAILIALVFWAVLHFDRKRTVSLARSAGTNQLAVELTRIADALERIANQPADRLIAAASAAANPGPPPAPRQPDPEPEPQPRGMPYSMFGR